eukprot:289826_1
MMYIIFMIYMMMKKMKVNQKKPFRLICNRHDLDPKKVLIVDDNATSWFDADRKITNFWMPPCYGYQIHDIDNELKLLCKYLWYPIQQNHLSKKQPQHTQQQQKINQNNNNNNNTLTVNNNKHNNRQLHNNNSIDNTTDSSVSPNTSPKREIITNNNSINTPISVSSPSYSNVSYQSHDEQKIDTNITCMPRISHSYNKRKYNKNHELITDNNHQNIHMNIHQKKIKNHSPKSPQTKTKKKPYFFESKSRGSKKLAKIIGK